MTDHEPQGAGAGRANELTLGSDGIVDAVSGLRDLIFDGRSALELRAGFACRRWQRLGSPSALLVIAFAEAVSAATLDGDVDSDEEAVLRAFAAGLNAAQAGPVFTTAIERLNHCAAARELLGGRLPQSGLGGDLEHRSARLRGSSGPQTRHLPPGPPKNGHQLFRRRPERHLGSLGTESSDTSEPVGALAGSGCWLLPGLAHATSPAEDAPIGRSLDDWHGTAGVDREVADAMATALPPRGDEREVDVALEPGCVRILSTSADAEIELEAVTGLVPYLDGLEFRVDRRVHALRGVEGWFLAEFLRLLSVG